MMNRAITCGHSKTKMFFAVIFSFLLTMAMMPFLGDGIVNATVTPYSDPGTNTFDLRDGNVTIADDTASGHEGKVIVTYGDSLSKDDIAPTEDITLTSDGTSTVNTVIVTTKQSVNIVLKNLSIDAHATDKSCAFKIAGEGDLSGRTVTIKLKGTNALTSDAARAGLEKNGAIAESGSLVIENGDTAPDTGSLTAISESYDDGEGAGIGAGYIGYNYPYGYSGGNITIKSGIITAKSNRGAGIGGGEGKTGGSAGKIDITGGYVIAEAKNGAGIGGGHGYWEKCGGGGDVTISGGSVKATSAYGNGIGQGNGSGGGTMGGGTLSSGTNGSAWIVAISTDSNAGIGADMTHFTSGVVFKTVNNNKKSAMYGTTVSLTSDSKSIEIPSNYELTIADTQTLNVPEGVTFNCNGGISNYGVLNSGSTIVLGNNVLFYTEGNVTIPINGKAVTIDPNGSGVYLNDIAYSNGGATVIIPDCSYRDGYTFVGWNDGVTTHSSGASITPSKAMTLTAQWEEDIYSADITPASKDFGNVTTGYSSIAPATFTITNTGNRKLDIWDISIQGNNYDAFELNKENVENVGYELDPSGGTTTSTTFTVKPKDNLAVGTYTANVQIYLNPIGLVSKTLTFTVTTPGTPQSPVTHSISLNGNGGNGASLTSYTEGTETKLPTDWTKSGYIFSGWYDNADFTGNAVTTVASTSTGDMTFYAKWTPVIVVPEAPTSVKAKVSGKHNAKVTWSSSKGADSYEIYMATKKDGKYTSVGANTSTFLTVKQLKPNKKYYFKVTAVNSAGASPMSKAAFVKMPAANSVGFVLSNTKGNNVKVHWKTVKGARRYQIADNATSTGKMKIQWTGSNGNCTYISVHKTKGKTYKYEMRYYKIKDGKKVYSSWTSVKTIKVE